MSATRESMQKKTSENEYLQVLTTLEYNFQAASRVTTDNLISQYLKADNFNSQQRVTNLLINKLKMMNESEHKLFHEKICDIEDDNKRCFFEGLLLEYGFSVERDLVLAKNYYRNSDQPLRELYIKDSQHPISDETDVSLLENMCNRYHPQALYFAIKQYATADEYSPDYKKYATYCCMLANLGDPRAIEYGVFITLEELKINKVVNEEIIQKLLDVYISAKLAGSEPYFLFYTFIPKFLSIPTNAQTFSASAYLTERLETRKDEIMTSASLGNVTAISMLMEISDIETRSQLRVLSYYEATKLIRKRENISPTVIELIAMSLINDKIQYLQVALLPNIKPLIASFFIKNFASFHSESEDKSRDEMRYSEYQNVIRSKISNAVIKAKDNRGYLYETGTALEKFFAHKRGFGKLSSGMSNTCETVYKKLMEAISTNNKDIEMTQFNNSSPRLN